MKSDPSAADHGPDSDPLVAEREGINVHLMPYSPDVRPEALLVLEGPNGQYTTNLQATTPGAQLDVPVPTHSTDESVVLKLNNGIFTIDCDSFDLVLDLTAPTVDHRPLVDDFAAKEPRIPRVRETDSVGRFTEEPDAVARLPPVRRPDTYCESCGLLFNLGRRPWGVQYGGQKPHTLCEGCGPAISEAIRVREGVEE